MNMDKDIGLSNALVVMSELMLCTNIVMPLNCAQVSSAYWDFAVMQIYSVETD